MINLENIRLNINSIIRHLLLPFSFNSTDIFEKETKNCKTFLDLGCGYHSPIEKIKYRNVYSIGVDIFKKSLDVSKEKKIHDDYLQLNILDIDKEVSPKSFDCVFL